jgi:GT2 family glycosyltransferase
MKPSNLAVLLTCYNRKQKTLACLAALSKQALPETIELCIYLVDDGSTDGTAEAVLQAHPEVKILQGDGSLFWTGGMQLAFAEAMCNNHDFYLWLNDDTDLYPTALQRLLKTFEQLTAEQAHLRAIVVGSTQDPENGEFTYGGVRQVNWLHPCKFSEKKPTNQPQPCDTMNGNCVLIPHEVAELVGGLDVTFRHYAADYDYGLRARRKGCTVWIAPGFIGTCAYNHPKTRMQNSKMPLSEQVQKLEQPKGVDTEDVILHPFWEWKAFTERHAGLLWPIYWLMPYRRMIWLTWFGKGRELNA